MGRASRWFRGLLGGKKADPAEPRHSKDKRRWGFVQSFREKPHSLPSPAAMTDDRKGSSYRELAPRPPYASPAPAMDLMMDEEEQNKRAIAVAAATAAVAEAAVAAAHAAAAVVRLTSSGRSPVAGVAGKRAEWAALKIQSAFRGYLARRALRALKGLVKLQALVRGNIVRKQAAETLRCMQALVRVQARARACRALQSERSWSERGPHLLAGPPTPEKHEQNIQEIVGKSDRLASLKRNLSKPSSIDAAAGWNWLDKWMEERYWDSRETNRKAGMVASTDDEKNAKILEVDPGKPQINHKRRSNHNRSSTATSDQNNRSFAVMPESPSMDSAAVQQSVPSLSSVEMQQCMSPLRFTVEPNEYVDSPQFFSASSRHGSSRRGPFTPSKSECSQSLFSGYSDYPNYMSNTESSRAKVRSQSAPKQRPELEKSNSMKRVSSHGMMQNSSSATSHRSSSLHAKFTNKAYPGSGRLDRLGMPIRI